MSSTDEKKKAPLPGAFLLVGSRSRGYSLVELIAVLVILGVLGAMAVPRLLDAPYGERAYAEEIAATLRYARTVAVASGCPVRFQMNQFGYTTAQDNPINPPLTHCGTANTWTTVVARADGTAMTGAPPAGVAVTGFPPAVLQIVFDSRGFVAPVPAPIAIGGSTVTVLPRGLVVGP